MEVSIDFIVVLHNFSYRCLDDLFGSGEKSVGENQDAQPAESKTKGAQAGNSFGKAFAEGFVHCP
jgi:hypothetical protein